MPTTLDKFFLQLAEKAGIVATDPKLVDLLGNTELNRINVPEELVQNIERSLLSVEDAKNNHPLIKTHYFAEVMSNVDRALDKIYTDFEFSEDEKADLARERSSTKRINLVAAKLKERHEAAMSAAGKQKDPNAQQHLQTINDLNAQLANLKTEMGTLKEAHKGELQSIKMDQALSGKLAGLKTVFDTLPADVRTLSVKQLLIKELQDNGIKLLLGENGGLQLQKEDGSNYFDENNRVVSVDDFIQRTLAKNKVLPQNPAPPKPGETQGQQHQQIVDGKPKADGKGNYSLKGMIDETMESLKNSNPVNVMNGTEGAPAAGQ